METINFEITEDELLKIKVWLMEEENESGEGFYCNWPIIEKMKNQMIVISQDNVPVGFLIWHLTSSLTSKIEILEIHPKLRDIGLGKKLVEAAHTFLKKRKQLVVEVQCSPPSSEDFWKKMGYQEFPGGQSLYNMDGYGDKNLYKTLVEHQEPLNTPDQEETIELWQEEPYACQASQPTFSWKIIRHKGSKKLALPIIQPSLADWRVRWSKDGETIVDHKIKYFDKQEIDFSHFMIIQNLPVV